MTRTRRLVFAPFAVGLVLLAAYTAYWVYAAGEIRKTLETSIGAHEADGYQIDYERLSVRGWPLRFDVRALEPVIQAPLSEGGWRFAAPEIAGGALPYDLNHWIVAARSPAMLETRIQGERARYRLEAETARISVSAEDGVTNRLGAEMDALTVTTLEGPPALVEQLEGLRLTGGVGADDAMTLRLQASAVRFAPNVLEPGVRDAFGAEADLFRLDAALSNWSALAADGDAGLWARRGGRLVVRGAQLVWGPARLEGDGDLTLDAQARPDGRLSVTVSDPEALVDALVAGRLISADQGEALRLAALMAPRRDGGVALPFRLQNGGVFLGPARLADAPPLR